VSGGKRWESASATVSRLLSVKVNVFNDLEIDTGCTERIGRAILMALSLLAMVLLQFPDFGTMTLLVRVRSRGRERSSMGKDGRN
jgi:hypothetical protein